MSQVFVIQLVTHTLSTKFKAYCGILSGAIWILGGMYGLLGETIPAFGLDTVVPLKSGKFDVRLIVKSLLDLFDSSSISIDGEASENMSKTTIKLVKKIQKRKKKKKN
jgi:hypothetical protein